MSRKPNIVLVAADGVGFADVGYNSAAGGIPTPSIDDLSAQGIRLNRNYVQSAATSSRASLLTGRYASNTGAALVVILLRWLLFTSVLCRHHEGHPDRVSYWAARGGPDAS